MSKTPGSNRRQRNHVVNSRWNDAEFDKLENLCRSSNKGKAETLRQLVRRADRNLPTTQAAVVQLLALGRNVNQLAKHANAVGTFSEVQVAQMASDVRQALRDLTR